MPCGAGLGRDRHPEKDDCGLVERGDPLEHRVKLDEKRGSYLRLGRAEEAPTE